MSHDIWRIYDGHNIFSRAANVDGDSCLLPIFDLLNHHHEDTSNVQWVCNFFRLYEIENILEHFCSRWWVQIQDDNNQTSESWWTVVVILWKGRFYLYSKTRFLSCNELSRFWFTEKLNNWELLVRYGFAINDVPQIFKIEIELDMIKRSCSGKLKYEAYDIQHMTK